MINEVNKYFLLLLVFFFYGCQHKKSIDPVVDTFLSLTKNAVQMKVTYGDSRLNSRKIVDTIINNTKEIEQMKDWLRQSPKSDTCYRLAGTIAFIDNKGNDFSIDFGLSSDCPSFYYFIEGKPVTLKMPYRSGMYLGEMIPK